MSECLFYDVSELTDYVKKIKISFLSYLHVPDFFFFFMVLYHIRQYMIYIILSYFSVLFGIEIWKEVKLLNN